MNEKRYNDLEKQVQYLNDEGFAGEGKQFMLFENADAAIDAIRQNQIPGITWTDEDEAKWQAQEAIRNAFGGEEVETRTDEFNDGALDTPELMFEDEVFMEPKAAIDLNAERIHDLSKSNIESWESYQRQEQLKEHMKQRNHQPLDVSALPEYREPIDWTTMPQEEVNFQWDALFEDDITTVEPKNNNIIQGGFVIDGDGPEI